MFFFVCMYHETLEGPLHHRKVRNPIGYDGKRVHRDVEASEQNADDYLRTVTCTRYMRIYIHTVLITMYACIF